MWKMYVKFISFFKNNRNEIKPLIREEMRQISFLNEI